MKKTIKLVSIWILAALPCVAANLNLETLRPVTTDGQFNLMLKQTEALAYAATNAGVSRITNFAYIVATNTITRTSGDYTTAYSPNDAICAGAGGATNPPVTLLGALPTGCGKIIKLRCVTDSVTPIGSLRFWFYNSTNVIWNTDNSAHLVYWTNAPNRLGYIDVTMVAGTACSYGMNIYDQLPIFNSTGTNIFYHVQALNAFTPTATTNFFLEATIQPSK